MVEPVVGQWWCLVCFFRSLFFGWHLVAAVSTVTCIAAAAVSRLFGVIIITITAATILCVAFGCFLQIIVGTVLLIRRSDRRLGFLARFLLRDDALRVTDDDRFKFFDRLNSLPNIRSTIAGNDAYLRGIEW